MEIQQEAT